MAKPKRANIKPASRCIFCGSSPATKEHIWSQWTLQYVPKRRGGIHSRAVYETRTSDGGLKPLREEKTYQGDVSTRQLRVVCATCNNGWMSALEIRVKPILTPLMLSMPVVLSAEAKAILSSWIALKCMCAEHSDPDRIVTSQEEREHLLQTRTPPDNWSIWIADQVGSQWRSGFMRVTATIGSAPKGQFPIVRSGDFAKNTQTFTMGIGALAIFAFSTKAPGFSVEPSQLGGRSLVNVWPDKRGVLWPTGPRLNDAQITAMSVSLRSAVDGLPWIPAPDPAPSTGGMLALGFSRSCGDA